MNEGPNSVCTNDHASIIYTSTIVALNSNIFLICKPQLRTGPTINLICLPFNTVYKAVELTGCYTIVMHFCTCATSITSLNNKQCGETFGLIYLQKLEFRKHPRQKNVKKQPQIPQSPDKTTPLEGKFTIEPRR